MAWLNLCGVVRKTECKEAYETLKDKLESAYQASDGYWVKFVPPGEGWENVYIMHDTGRKQAVDLSEEDEEFNWEGKRKNVGDK